MGNTLGKYREKLDIVADILNIVSKNARKTQIMYGANLNYGVLQKYIADMTKAGLIVFHVENRLYSITDKGAKFLDTYKEYRKSNKFCEKYLSGVENRRSFLSELCEAS